VSSSTLPDSLATCGKSTAEPTTEQGIEYRQPAHNLVSILVEIIWGCNLHCTLCNVHKIKSRLMSAEKIEEIFKKVPTLKYFTIIGLGEPLVHPEWYKIMDLIKKYNLRLNFVTNGLALHEEKINSLPLNTGVTFSIDSFNHEIYKAMRPGGDLVKTLRNLQNCAQHRPDVEIGIQSLVTKKTFPYINDIAIFAQKFGFGVNLLYPVTFSEEMYKEHYPETQHPLKVITSPRACMEPFRSLMVGISGDIYPCCYVYGSIDKQHPVEYFDEYVDGKVNRVSTKEYNLGNIFEDDVYKIWNAVPLCKIRGSIQNSLQKTKEYCALRDETDYNDTYNYCKICALRWGKMC
jgi:MoaA/NifB/PqqE/SkfB family radical SAM enzyme